MDIPAHFGQQQLDSLNLLRSSDRRHVKTIFKTCKPPAIDSFVGEFDAELLDQGGTTTGIITQILFGTSGNWIGKAFRPTSATSGVGYNCFRQGDQVLAKLPMDTRITASKLDAGLSLIISYRARHHGLIRWLTGEVREVVPGVLLGIGLYGPKVGKRDRLRRKIPFLMVGPVRDYQYDNPWEARELNKAA